MLPGSQSDAKKPKKFPVEEEFSQVSFRSTEPGADPEFRNSKPETQNPKLLSGLNLTD
jgi:hypothetical protein